VLNRERHFDFASSWFLMRDMLSEIQQHDYHQQGYLVLPHLFSVAEMNGLKNAAKRIVDEFDPASTSAIFTTKDHSIT